MICQRCLQPFTPSRYGHGETVCPVCVEELAADDRERQEVDVPPHCRERDEQPTHDVSQRWDGGVHNRPGDEHNPEGTL